MTEHVVAGNRRVEAVTPSKGSGTDSSHLVDLVARLQTACGPEASPFDNSVIRCASWPMDLSDWLHPRHWRYPRVRLSLDAGVDRRAVLYVTAMPVKQAKSRSSDAIESGSVDFAGMSTSMTGVRPKVVMRMPLGLIEDGLAVGDEETQAIVRRARRRCVLLAYGCVLSRWAKVFDTVVETGLVAVDDGRLGLLSEDGLMRMVDQTAGGK